jgi:hypothetical protein
MHTTLENRAICAYNGKGKCLRRMVFRLSDHPHTVEVTGSNPVPPTRTSKKLPVGANHWGRHGSTSRTWVPQEREVLPFDSNGGDLSGPVPWIWIHAIAIPSLHQVRPVPTGFAGLGARCKRVLTAPALMPRCWAVCSVVQRFGLDCRRLRNVVVGGLRWIGGWAVDAELPHAAAKRVGVQAQDCCRAPWSLDDPSGLSEDPKDVAILHGCEWGSRPRAGQEGGCLIERSGEYMRADIQGRAVLAARRR